MQSHEPFESHSPWPLFAEDLPLARHWLLSQWRTLEQIPRGLAHVGLGLGLLEETNRLCASDHSKIETRTKQQLRFRIALRQDLANPYTELLGIAGLQAKARHFQASNEQKTIALLGGIGDQLQLISLLKSWNQDGQKSIRLEASPTRVRQLQRCCATLPWIELHPWSQPLENYELTQVDLAAMLWQQGYRHHEIWLSELAQMDTPPQLLCCWRAAGQGDAFSAFSRSISFNMALGFYQDLHSKRNWPSQSIIDLTCWQPWEKKLLEKSGIKIHDPAKGDIWDLASLAGRSRVITIDTALAHLCAAMGHQATVLLPFYEDERWPYLLKPNQCYSNYLRTVRQTNYGDWKQALDEAISTL
jgi:hypothetical protein